jgi:hypothetical protein
MDAKDYRIIMTIASNLAQPVICNGKTIYELNLAQFVNAIDNIYPELYMPVARNGVVLNPKADENIEEEE